MLHNIQAILNVNLDWVVLEVEIANAFDIISQMLYPKSCTFQGGSYFNLYLSFVLFMPHSFFFFFSHHSLQVNFSII
jgi:hypothetical protein